MKGVSLVLLAVLGLAAPTKPAAAQSKSAVSSGAPTRISDAEVSKDGTVQIRFNNGRSIQVPAEKGQAGRERLKLIFYTMLAEVVHFQQVAIVKTA
jgi:hypothetical protein